MIRLENQSYQQSYEHRVVQLRHIMVLVQAFHVAQFECDLVKFDKA